ncbi:16872_t:CDS:1, partial [Cetraspora pellucida]
FEQIIKGYSNSIKYDDDMFNNNIEELDKIYISDEDNLDEIRQFDCKNLEVNEIIFFNIFLKEPTNNMIHNNKMKIEKELDSTSIKLLIQL